MQSKIHSIEKSGFLPNHLHTTTLEKNFISEKTLLAQIDYTTRQSIITDADSMKFTLPRIDTL